MRLDPVGVRQLLRFALVGVVNTAVHYVVFMGLLEWLEWHYLLASTTGFIAGVINSYLLNLRWTFAPSGRPMAIEFSRFFVVSTGALLVNLGCMALLVDVVGLYPGLAQIPGILATLLVNFAGNKYWSFRPIRQR